MRKGIIIGVALAGLLLGQAARNAEVQFKAAQHKEQVEGDLKGAIEQYKKIVQSGDRTMSAKALVAMGQCYEKLGQNDARTTYERVVKDFADQGESVQLARVRLTALAAPVTRGLAARQVWTSPEQDPSLSLVSPDGRYVGFTDWATGDLGVYEITTGASRRLTNTGGWEKSADYAIGSVISSDSRQIAYVWFLDKELQLEIRVLALSGGAPKTVYRTTASEYLVPQGWTPDGKQLVIVRTLPDRSSQIALLSILDGSIRALKSFTWQDVQVTLSPDGRHIAYHVSVESKSRARDIFVIATDGSRENVVVQHPADDFSPHWSPDGSRLLFLSDRTGNPSLWSVRTEDARPNGTVELVKADIGPISPLGVTRAGTLYYASSTGGRGIYVAGLDTNMKLSKEPALIPERFVNSNFGPALSPDGQSLAYYSVRNGTTFLVIRTVKTGLEKDLLLGRGVIGFFGMGPKWYPDGRSMLVLSRGSDQPGLVFQRVDLASGNTEALQRADQNGFQGFSFSPDGKAIFYTEAKSDGANFRTRLLRYDLDSRRQTELKSDVWVIAPTVSPDGKQLAFVISGRPGSSIAIMPAAGGESREIFHGAQMSGGARYNSLGWTPDQRYILFVQNGENAPNALWRVPVAGGQAEQIGLSFRGRIKSPQIHPDGRTLFFGTLDRAPTELWALENSLPKTAAAK